ncbi:MAG: flagellin [Ruminococcus sp.]|nr:flagellin [Ruminococcus sp.]
MVVRTNTMAINANNALNKNNSTVAGNLEKLSTGFKINRAADDASGLAISEKMKAQIKALDTASKNAQDGASLIKTAEGYMGEVHDMLNRIVELAEKSANGTYETGKTAAGATRTAAEEDFTIAGGTNNTGVDRQALQDEVNQLCAEIDRIADTANFNELKLFNGDMTTATTGKTTAVARTANTKVGDIITEADTTGIVGSGSALTLQIGETSSASDKLSVSMMNLKTDVLFHAMSKSSVATEAGNANGAKAVNLTAANGSSGSKVSKNDNGLTLNISNQYSASVVAEKVRDVINDVSASRANLGALENRLDYTMNNLNTASENITDANSRIRDTDMAKTMMQYTQGNTLTQAAQAMLAQANQAPSSVLQLLQ